MKWEWWRDSRTRLVSSACAGLALLVPLSSCVSDVDVTVEEQVLWEADLTGGLDHPGVTGSAAAVSTSNLTEAGIEVVGLQPGVYAWRIREANCGDPGQGVGGPGQYPELVVEESGSGDNPPDLEASSETAPFRASMAPEGAYHAEVTDADSGERVACGEFDRR
ncbi:MAG: hypothetical protein ACOCUZ_02490 [bacterium]